MVDGRVDGPNDIRRHISWTGQAEPNVETDFAKPQLIKGWNLRDCPALLAAVIANGRSFLPSRAAATTPWFR